MVNDVFFFVFVFVFCFLFFCLFIFFLSVCLKVVFLHTPDSLCKWVCLFVWYNVFQ